VKEFEFLHIFDELKTEKFAVLTRESLKHLLKVLKKYLPAYGSSINNDYVFTFH
jgi:hypothetical protein